MASLSGNRPSLSPRSSWWRRWSTRPDSAGGRLRRAVAKKPARCGARACTVFEGDGAVDHDPAVPLGPAHLTPLVSGIVPCLLLWSHAQLLEVVDDEVGGHSLADEASVAESGSHGREGAE